MKKVVILSILTLISFCLHAQTTGYIVTKNDSLKVNLYVKKKNADTKIFYKLLHEENSHEIDAENADFVLVPGKWKYISTPLTSSKKNVWAKCYFDGAYKLVSYKSAFYIITPEKTYLLESKEKDSRSKKYRGMMIALFSQEVPYKYKDLNYDSKSLTRPIKLYHEKKGISYTDYNRYTTINSTTQVFSGVAQARGTIYLNSTDKNKTNGYSGTFGIENIYTFPDLSERLSFSIGAKFNLYKFDSYGKNTSTNNTTYIDFNNVLYSAGGQGGVIFHIVKKPKFNLSLQSGIEALKPFGPDTEVRIEKLTGNTVNTSRAQISTYKIALINQFNQLLFNFPEFSKSLQAGIGGSYPLNAPQEERYVFSVGSSYNFSVYFIF